MKRNTSDEIQGQTEDGERPGPLEGLYFYQCDHLGTPMALTDADGKVAWEANYKAWGEAKVAITKAANAAGLVNPIRFQGQYPIPTGNYAIGAQGTYVTNSGTVLPGAMTLIPQPGNWPYGRSGFLIHGDNRRGNRSASEGCVILGPSLRNMIGGSADTTLRVVP